jgi:hypothetical protein
VLLWRVMAAGTQPLGSQSPTSVSRTIEKVFDESQYTGEINLSGRKLKDYPKCACKYDLVDTTSAGKHICGVEFSMFVRGLLMEWASLVSC